jgi:hypothetical protein
MGNPRGRRASRIHGWFLRSPSRVWDRRVEGERHDLEINYRVQPTHEVFIPDWQLLEVLTWGRYFRWSEKIKRRAFICSSGSTSVLLILFRYPTKKLYQKFCPWAGTSEGLLIFLERFGRWVERFRESWIWTCRTTMILGDQSQSIKQGYDN